MKKHIIGLLALLFCTGVFAQMESHIRWQYSTKKISNSEIDLIFTATIDEGWHLYGQYFEDGGPVRLEFIFDESASYKKMGKVTESPHPHEVLDDIFNMKVQYFEKKATFTQRVEILSATPCTIKGALAGQICLTDGACMMVNEDFSFECEGVKIAESTPPAEIKHTEIKQESQPVAPAEINKPVRADSVKQLAKTEPTLHVDPPTNKKQNDSPINTSLLWFFGFSFLAGLLAILTPCVFPMIPMTVSFFMHSGKSKAKAKLEALFYGISIVFIYTVVGTIVAFTFGPSFANFLSTHWLPNIFFFLIFLVFAASFFGMFEIMLPSWLVNKADSRVDKGGIWGPFFMAFTLVLVSFSCTGPIVGAVLVQSAGGEFLKPIVGMLGFSLAFALPFTLFAFFPSWLSNLPKSGGWLNTVKVVLGFIELALGLKFLSMADLTYHWHILDREVFLVFWIIIFFLLGVYLLGKLKFAHDSEVRFISVPRLLMAICSLSFALYMVPGLWGAPLKALSGYIPPMTTHDFDLNQIIRDNDSGTETVSTNELCDVPEYSEFLHLPHGIKGYFDWDQAVACAKSQNKPLFIDFTGHGCANCRKMEENVWSDPRILSRLKQDYIVVSLYVDDKTELPQSEWITTPEGKVKKTLGAKYSYIQETRFKANSQPHYILLDANGNPLTESRYFDLDKDKFVEFLDNGKAEFAKKTK